MKNVLLTIFFGLLLTVSGCTPQNASTARQNLNAREAKELIETKKEVVILDVRTPEEFHSGHVDGAINLDFYAPDFDQKLANLDKETPYLIYCASGNRSGQTTAKMEKQDFKNIYNSQAGFTELKSEGVPTK
ncbi:MAG TPA: rhodanese-like domain-containing protein [Adhaeribacter sp.]|nr:rhodanese-like domain-containing protein [Adhaeribacter sp.]